MMRSRLEAHWAAFFDLLGWPWEYEPEDLNRYLPDFMLRLPDRVVLVEVKPSKTWGELLEHTNRIERSDWTGPALLVGGWLFNPEGGAQDNDGQSACIGLMSNIPHARLATDPPWVWRPTLIRKGPGKGPFLLGGVDEAPFALSDAKVLWGKAHKKVQWKPKLPHHTPDTPEDSQMEVIEPAPDTLLSNARRTFWNGVDAGTTCYCCNRKGQRYRRKLNSGMARGLVTLLRLAEENSESWVNVTVHELPGLPLLDAATRERLTKWEIHKLRFWGLIEMRANCVVDKDRESSGVWRVTQTGKDFAAGRISVARHVYEYDGEAHGFSDERVAISEAYGDGFDFDELMTAEAHPAKKVRTPKPPAAQTTRVCGTCGVSGHTTRGHAKYQAAQKAVGQGTQHTLRIVPNVAEESTADVIDNDDFLREVFGGLG